jgi:superfamily I DNA and/or RNA helicase
VRRWVCEQGGIRSRDVSNVEFSGRNGAVEVPDRWEEALLAQLNGSRLQGKRIRAWSDPTSTADEADEFFGHFVRLVKLESRAEAQQALARSRRGDPHTAERSGQTLLGLELARADDDLGGRVVLVFRKRRKSRPQPNSRLGLGSPVTLSPESGGHREAERGVISAIDGKTVSVAFDTLPAGIERPITWRLDLAYDEAVTQRQLNAMKTARRAERDRLAELRDVLLGRQQPRFEEVGDPIEFDPRLNESQRDAVRFALSAQDVALIHGPPGTGKTTAAVEFIRQCVLRGDRVLACAPSNRATDNLLERLMSLGTGVVRIGHPARVLPHLRSATLDCRVEDHEDTDRAMLLESEAAALRRRSERFQNSRRARRTRQNFQYDAGRLEAEARRIRSTIASRILDRARVVLSTTTGLDADLLGRQDFDVVVIDEACQGTEPTSWIPLLKADRVVLAGDHCQLAPTVLSAEAAEGGLGISLFERIHDLFGESVTRRLDVQYRMHRQIMDFSSREFYNGTLLADESVASHTLADLPHVRASSYTTSPVEFLDTAGRGYFEQLERNSESKANPAEAILVTQQVHALLAQGLKPSEIAVISPYAAQTRALRNLLPIDGLEIDSVDGFQGREKEAVILSLVRSNETGEIGFLAETRRTNVALTRAKRKLIVIGDSDTLGTHPFYRRLFHYFSFLGVAMPADNVEFNTPVVR